MREKVKSTQYAAIFSKLSTFQKQVKETLGEDELLATLVTLEEEIDKLEKRKDSIKQQVQSRKELMN
jgi:hypothetical protein